MHKHHGFQGTLKTVTMVGGLLVIVTAVVALAQEPSYKPTGDACADAPAADFEDVPNSHPNAKDIDCIAHYDITHGTSATMYSPAGSVIREHMALFLTRLAAKVGINMSASPPIPPFSDIGGLSPESQNAIAQLADLRITYGTSATTFSPTDPVRRDHMALFIARLMEQMPDTAWGYKPSDVTGGGTPFVDLGVTTPDSFDAITQLYELGVASGLTATAYAPEAHITRASMAEFMARLLDHSIQGTATTTTSTTTTSTTTTTTTTTQPEPEVSDCPYTSRGGDPCAVIPQLGDRRDNVNCGHIPNYLRPLTVVGTDYDRLDRDRDGRACE